MLTGHSLSVVNSSTDKKVADIKINGDTLEAMAPAPASPLLYINNPSKSLVDVVNHRTRAVVATWPDVLEFDSTAEGNFSFSKSSRFFP